MRSFYIAFFILLFLFFMTAPIKITLDHFHLSKVPLYTGKLVGTKSFYMNAILYTEPVISVSVSGKPYIFVVKKKPRFWKMKKYWTEPVFIKLLLSEPIKTNEQGIVVSKHHIAIANKNGKLDFPFFTVLMFVVFSIAIIIFLLYIC